MKKTKSERAAAILATLIVSACSMVYAHAAVPMLENAATPAADSRSIAASGLPGDVIGTAEEFLYDIEEGGTPGSGSGELFGDTAETDGTPGDAGTDADGWIGDESDSAGTTAVMTGETETAQTSSGMEEESGSNLLGIVIALIIIAAVAALLFAFLPRQRRDS